MILLLFVVVVADDDEDDDNDAVVVAAAADSNDDYDYNDVDEDVDDDAGKDSHTAAVAPPCVMWTTNILHHKCTKVFRRLSFCLEKIHVRRHLLRRASFTTGTGVVTLIFR